MAYTGDPSTYSTASGKNLHYVVIQVTLKEKLIGTGLRQPYSPRAGH